MRSYTVADLRKFNRLTLMLSSRRQMDRITARLDLATFEKEHGKAKCEEMFKVLQARDTRNAKRRGDNGRT